jgi:hypothetical protein
MPTPFNHLLIARDLLAADLPADLRRVLAAERPAFLLGNIAPDVQTITGQTREATHFFPVPLRGAPPAHQRLFAQSPALADPARLPAAQAAFLAGYLAHLEFDQWWIRDVFEPVFGPEQAWGSFMERLYLHNALRAYWDADDLRAMPDDIAPALSVAAPHVWLPFVADRDLGRWRDFVADQLHLGAAQTITVFAERMKADPEVFAALVNSPDEMDRRVFNRIALDRLAHYRAHALAASLALLQAYWAGALK